MDGTDPDAGKGPGIARWQKVVGVIGVIVVLLLALLLFGPGGGGHGPGRHVPGGERDEQPAEVEDRHDPSLWDH